MLRLPVDDCREATTSSQFLDWMIFMEMDWMEPTRTDYYLAQIALVVKQMFADPETSEGKKLLEMTPKDMLIQFKALKPEEPDPVKEVKTPEQIQMEADKVEEEKKKWSAVSKAVWAARMGKIKRPTARNIPGPKRHVQSDGSSGKRSRPSDR